jgi:hypothetical protein
VPEAEPDLTELFGEEYPGPALQVKPAGPTTTHELPSRFGALDSIALPAPVGGAISLQPVLGRDDKRKRTVLVSDVDIQLARQPSDRHGAYWPAKVPLVIKHIDPVFVAATTTAGTCTVVIEYWAD